MARKKIQRTYHPIELSVVFQMLVAEPETFIAFILSDEKYSYRFLLDKFMRHGQPAIAKHGGLVEERCSLTIPDGRRFLGAHLRGDIDGIRKQIALGAVEFGSQIAHAEGDRLLISDGSSVLLSNCVAEGY